jgi:hypothetical protein
MGKLRAVLRGGVVFLIGLLPARVQPAALPRQVVVPIVEVVLSSGVRRYAVSLRIGSRPIVAGVDTGSSGLRVLERAVDLDDLQVSERPEVQSYGAGVRVEGVVARGRVQIGGAAANGVTPLHLVRSVGCMEDRPDCAAGRLGVQHYGFQGDGLSGEGFDAILGLNLADGEVANPLPALGVERWIIELPRGAVPGRLILNPSDQTVRAYRRVALNPAFAQSRGGIHDAVAGCLINRASGERQCLPVLLDTGAAGIALVGAEGAGQAWSEGTPASLELGEDAAVRLDFVIGLRDHASRMSVAPLKRGNPRLVLGPLPFYGFSVLYDHQQQSLGLLPRKKRPSKMSAIFTSSGR